MGIITEPVLALVALLSELPAHEVGPVVLGKLAVISSGLGLVVVLR